MTTVSERVCVCAHVHMTLCKVNVVWLLMTTWNQPLAVAILCENNLAYPILPICCVIFMGLFTSQTYDLQTFVFACVCFVYIYNYSMLK